MNLKLVEPERRRRRQIRQLYTRHLAGLEGILLPALEPGVTDSCQYFVLRIDEARFGMSRDALHQELKRYNVISRKYFHPLCSEYAPYGSLPSSRPELLPVANRIKSQVLCLPFYGELTDGEIEHICSLIRHLQARGS